MAKVSSRKRKKAKTARKGRIVEQIAAQIHSAPGVIVRKNVRLPVRTHGKKSKRKREIDVLVTGTLAGYKMSIPIECKNEKDPIGAPRIDSFVGTLDDVGLPTENAIYISTSGFTKGAIERAHQAGIHPLLLTGLDEERLSSAVTSALQSCVYLLADLLEFRIENDTPKIHPREAGMFWSPDGKKMTLLPNLVLEAWLKGVIPSEIGQHDLNLELPEGWHQKIDGKPVVPKRIGAKVQVIGLIVKIKGQATAHHLIDKVADEPRKSQVRAEFPPGDSDYPVTLVFTEDELTKFFEKRTETVKLTIGRFKLPRIKWRAAYWPVSEKAFKKIKFHAERGDDPDSLKLEDIEGTNLAAMWDPLM